MQLLFSITRGTVSLWWVPVCLLCGLLYAWILYTKTLTLGKYLRYLLFAVRALVVTIIALTLLSPLVKTVSYDPQKPLVLVLQDNSQSIELFAPAKSLAAVSALSTLQKELGSEYDVQEFHFNRDIFAGLTSNFTGHQTNIANALHQLNDRFVNRNVGALILASDGLYNQGSDPQYEAKNFKTAIFTIALGDTTARRDVLIGNVNYNKTAFLGNDFEVEALTEAYQAKGENMHVTVTEDGRQVASQTVSVKSNDFHQVVPLKLHADKKGLRKFTIGIASVKNELSVQNNSETIYVDVLDAREKVLLLYNAPHPDVSVIKQSIESDKNYQVKTSLLANMPAMKAGDYSLIILYQVAANSTNLNGLVKAKVPMWYIAGAQTDITGLNAEQKLAEVSVGKQEMQEVFAQPSAEFTAFTLSDSSARKIVSFPPLLAPYGSYTTPGAGSTLLRQRIGNVETTYPLLAFGDEGGQRMGLLTGEGLWRWQLAEYQAYGNHHALEELFARAVQYLTANATRQRFLVYPPKHVFDEGENVILNAELYNDALELINTPDVKIDLKSEKGKSYSFLFTRTGQGYQLDAGTLPVGEYTYSAIAKNGVKEFNATGQLTVKPLNLEAGQSAANNRLLNNIAVQSGGKMLQPGAIDQLPALIRKNDNVKTVVYEDKRYNDIIDVKWIFALILALLSIEWFLRKREGEV